MGLKQLVTAVYATCLLLLTMGDPNITVGGETIKELNASLSLDDILDRIENRYARTGFSARFEQMSTIKMLDITDTASGQLFVKRPGKMRWIYKRPDEQMILTDGLTLWIYKPEDNQVMVGNYPAFFGDGKGASFLSDMKLIRKKFQITLDDADNENSYRLKLIPGEKEYDISKIYLMVSKGDFNVTQIETYNADGDETRIDLKDIQFEEQLPDSLFNFDIREGMDVLQLDE